MSGKTNELKYRAVYISVQKLLQSNSINGAMISEGWKNGAFF